MSYETVAHTKSELNATFEIENRQKKWNFELKYKRFWFTHVGDDTIVACRGTELKESDGLYSLGMLKFHSKSAFSTIQN